MGSPMAPSPMNPMRMRVLQTSRPGLGELRQPLGGAAEQLVDHGVHVPQVAPAGQRVQREGLARQRAVTPQRSLDRELLGRDVPAHDLAVGRRQRRTVTTADAVGVDDTDRLQTASSGSPIPWPVFGMLTGASKGSPLSIAWIIGEGSSPDCQVCRSLVPASHASTSAT